MKIIVKRTDNPTPERSWDYAAYFERDQEAGPFHSGETPEKAVRSLLEDNSTLTTMEINAVTERREWEEV